MQAIHEVGKSIFNKISSAIYGPSPTSSRQGTQSSILPRKRPWTHEGRASNSSPASSRKKVKANRAEGSAPGSSSSAKPIEVADSSAEEEEAAASEGAVQLQEVAKASAMSEIRVNCSAASLGAQLFGEGDYVSLGFRRWQPTCLLLRSDNLPARAPSIAEFAKHDLSSMTTWKLGSSPPAGGFPSPFAAFDLAGRSGGMVLFPEASEIGALGELVRSFSSAGLPWVELASAAAADEYLTAFPAGAPPRHRPLTPRKDASDVLFSYPWGRQTKDPIEVRPGDVHRLDPGQLLNDVIVDLFLRRLATNLDGTPTATADAPRAVVMNSLFFTRLSAAPLVVEAAAAASAASAAHRRVAKWASGANLFESDLVLVPVHHHLHWSLVAVCHLKHLRFQGPGRREEEDPLHPKPVLLVLDSLRAEGLHDPTRTAAFLKAFLTHEYRTQHSRSSGQGSAAVAAIEAAAVVQPPSLPQQANFVDCGGYVVKTARDLYDAVNPRSNHRPNTTFSAAQWAPPPCSPAAMAALRAELAAQCGALEREHRYRAPS